MHGTVQWVPKKSSGRDSEDVPRPCGGGGGARKTRELRRPVSPSLSSSPSVSLRPPPPRAPRPFMEKFCINTVTDGCEGSQQFCHKAPLPTPCNVGCVGHRGRRVLAAIHIETPSAFLHAVSHRQEGIVGGGGGVRVPTPGFAHFRHLIACSAPADVPETGASWELMAALSTTSWGWAKRRDAPHQWGLGWA